jgi:hypothetical protein
VDPDPAKVVAHGRAGLLLHGSIEGLPTATRPVDAAGGVVVEVECLAAAALGEQALDGTVA